MAPAIPVEYTGQKGHGKCLFSQLMGKPKKYSKGGISSSFSHDCRHAVETMGQSEGFGSSRRIYTEIMESEDYCARKRKCINLDSYDNFGVPMQVLSLSKMSRRERKDLVLRLKMELEQVQMLQKKAGSFGTNVVLSPSTDNRSCSDGKKRPPLDSVHQSVEVRSSHGKKRPFGGHNSAYTKKNPSGGVESQKLTVAMSNSNAHSMKECETLLNRLMQHNFGWVFNSPVDVVKLNIPDYFTVIKHPMDLGTVKKRITSGYYSNPMDFAADVHLTFSNAMTYNPPGNDVNFMAKTLSKYFEVRWKAIEKKLPVTTDVGAVNSTAAAPIEGETNSNVLPLKNKKINPKDTITKPEPIRQTMTDQEKHNLSTDLQSLLGELPENIVDFLKEQSSCDGQGGEDEIEIDIDALSNETLYKLRKLLDDYLHEKQKNQAKAESCEMELLNESGFSNSSMQPCKGNDHVDEVVDVVGSGYPLVAIEKGSTHRNSRCSSSSGESGSSSSDSGSAKASIPLSSTKENLNSGRNVESKNQSSVVPDDGNQSLKEFGQVELNSHDKSSAVEEEGHQDEESAPSERPVSPEKLYRAALLRNRFADTILKAREKALEKGEKGDPEKLRMEREELERRQREEKARLQAEAKAAEEVKRKAEAEAAAEAKRKRELEREAARQALLEMEKTVDINESSQFIQDLEMCFVDGEDYRSNPLEQLGLYMKEDDEGEENEPPQSAPEPANNVEEGSNPLEQLGLYIKADDKDEEDEPCQSTPEPVNDVEDGEID
ncbi:nuclear protein X1 [Hibiscus trionum]|uniref:Nuclear protein X1 n=1 Tax=Hibiscus trionum TaxID=183268 RepID=A0A9W7JFR0_HIBTR|nr:nuclear protein X1 [Hibiscus trionum]